METQTMTIAEIQKELGIGRPLAERYVRESGLALPRKKRGQYRVPRAAFLAWIGGAGR